jgi:hypothetical protein
VDWDEVEKNLRRFKAEIQQSLQSSLGQDLFSKLRQNGVFSQFDAVPHR